MIAAVVAIPAARILVCLASSTETVGRLVGPGRFDGHDGGVAVSGEIFAWGVVVVVEVRGQRLR
jgi:hypothetical protein